jgi:hypothetical protein
MSFRFPVEGGHILMFARAIGDPNPRYDAALSPDEPVDLTVVTTNQDGTTVLTGLATARLDESTGDTLLDSRQGRRFHDRGSQDRPSRR